MTGKLTCISNTTTFSSIVHVHPGLHNKYLQSLATHDCMPISNDHLVAVYRPQSGTTGNLMCKTQSTAIMPIKTSFYKSADPMTVACVSLCIIRIRCLPRRRCSAAIVWNHWELVMQNNVNGHYAKKPVSGVSRPNDSGRTHTLHHISPVSTPPSLFCGHCLEPLGTSCAKHNMRAL